MNKFTRYGQLNTADCINGAQGVRVWDFNGTRKELLGKEHDSIKNFHDNALIIKTTDSKPQFYVVDNKGCLTPMGGK